MANWTTTGYELFNATALPATAEFTIIPNAGYSISAAQFEYEQTLDYIVDITFSDNGNAGTPTNTVKGTIQFVGSDDYTFNADIQQSITLSVIEEEQINAITLSTAVTVQSYGNNAFTSGGDVNISTNSSYTGYEATINDSFNWNVQTANSGTTYAAFPSVSVPLDSHVNFMEILITPDPGHYFADSPNEDADGNEIFALEDSSLTLHLPGVGSGTQSYQAEEYLNEQSWEITRELIMEPVNGATQSTSGDVMVCTGIKFIINYFSPATVLLLDLNNNNTYDEELIINVSIPGVVPRALYFLDQGPLHVGYGQLSSFQLPIKNTVTSYTFTESGDDTDIFDPDPQAFANFVSLNLAQNTASSEKSATLTITANSATVSNSPSTTSSSIQVIQNPGPFINAYGKLSSQDENSYSQGVETVSSFGDTITLKVETNLPDNNEFTAAEALLDPLIVSTENQESSFVNNGQQVDGSTPLTDAEVETITTEIQNGFNIAQQSNNVATVQISIPENTDSNPRIIVLIFNHPLDSSITSSIAILQAAAYSASVNTLQFFAATGYNSDGIPTGFEDLGNTMPLAKTDNNYIQNDGGIIKIYAFVSEDDLGAGEASLQDMFVLQNLSQVNPPVFSVISGSPSDNNYFLSSNEEGYQHFNNLQVNSFIYNSSTMTGGPVNIEITFNAPQNDYYFSSQANAFDNLLSGNLGLNFLEPKPAELQILGYNPLNPYFAPNNTSNNSPDDIASFKQAQLDTVIVSSSGNDPSGSLVQVTDNLDVDYFDSETGQVKVEILQYKDSEIDLLTGDLVLTDWKTTAIDGPPSWCGFDENFTTSSITSSVSSEAFGLTNFPVTLHHQASSSDIGRSVKLGYSTLSASVDSSDVTTFNQPFAKVKTLNFTTPADSIVLHSVLFEGNDGEENEYIFDENLPFTGPIGGSSNSLTGADFEINHSGPGAAYSGIGHHEGYWRIRLLNSFNAANNLVGGLTSDRIFTFRFKLDSSFPFTFKIYKAVIEYQSNIIHEEINPTGLTVSPDANGYNFINFFFVNTETINGEQFGNFKMTIDSDNLLAAKNTAAAESSNVILQKLYIVVSRESYDGDINDIGPYPNSTELIIINFAEINPQTFTLS